MALTMISVALLAAAAGSADAANCYYAQTVVGFLDPDTHDFSITFTNVGAPAGGGTLTFTALGDFDRSDEYVEFIVEGISFGPFLNSDPLDDFYSGPTGDIGGNYSNSTVARTGTAAVSLPALQSYAADGTVSILVHPVPVVNDDPDAPQDEFITIELIYPGPCTPAGACCLADAACDVMTENDCVAAGGTYQGDDVSCRDTDCASTDGACCIGGACSLQTESDCLAGGGTFNGIGTDCTGDGDADGVPDACDACPGTVPGVDVNPCGCPANAVPPDLDQDGDVDLCDLGFPQPCSGQPAGAGSACACFDLDHNGTVDPGVEDQSPLPGSFAACASGPLVPFAAGCAMADFDGDGDIDQGDFSRYQCCFSGSGMPAVQGCAD